MTAGRLHFNDIEGNAIEQGATWEFPFSYEDGNKNPIDISDYTALMHVRENFESDLIVELSTENGRIIIDSNNEFMLRLDASVTELLPVGRFLYTLEFTDTLTDEVLRALEGEIVVRPRVTI